MKYRVFDSDTRRFTNVPIQTASTFHWPPEEETHSFWDEEDRHPEQHHSDELNQQPSVSGHDAEKEPEQEAEVIEIIDDPSPGEGE